MKGTCTNSVKSDRDQLRMLKIKSMVTQNNLRYSHNYVIMLSYSDVRLILLLLFLYCVVYNPVYIIH